jgi:outer membrane protein insertion porin family
MRALDRFTSLPLRGAAVLAATLLWVIPAWSQGPPTPVPLPTAPGGAPVPAPTAPPAVKVTVADIRIQGSEHISTAQVMTVIKLRVGADYSDDAVWEDVRLLYATKQFGNIEAATTKLANGNVVVYYFIRDYREVIDEVIYKGAKHLKDEELDHLTGCRKGMPLSPTANRLACKKIVDKYNEDGRPFASCDLLMGGRPGDTKVIFNITEGPKVGLRGVSFSGNSWAVSGRLMTLIQSKPTLGLFPGKYIPQMIEQDMSKIEEYYKTFGFLDAHVARELQLTPDGKDVNLVFHIQEGMRYTFAGPAKINGVKALPAEEVEQLPLIKTGAYYSQPIVDGGMNAIKDFYGYTGRNAKVQVEPVFNRNNPGVVQMQYEVTEYPQARVGQIFIAGNERTRQHVILRQLPLYPGQLLTYPDLRTAERNLQRLGIFETSQDGNIKPTVTVIDPDDKDKAYKDILVTVQEANTGSLVFGAGINSSSGLTGSIVLNERNFDILRVPTSFDDLLSGNAFRGAGQEFRIEAVPGTQLQRYTVSWREPFLFDTPNSLGLTGYYYTRDYNEYNEERVGGRLTVGRKITPEWTLSGGFRVEQIDVNNVVDFAPIEISQYVGSHFLVGPRVSATYDTRDSYLRPTSGNIVDLSYEQDFGDYTFPVLTASYNQFWTLFQRPDGSGRQVLSLKSLVSYAGSETPVYERFYAGGFQSIRGFEFRGVGPDINGFKIGGDFMILNSMEYQIPVLANDNVYVVGFVDSGTVESKVKITDYRVSAGFGLRLVVPMLGPVPIALDFGFPLVKGPNDNVQVFSFFMGFSR